MSYCSTCSGYVWDSIPGFHRCPPAWLVWHPDTDGDNPEDARTVYATDEEAAAEAWAEQSDGESLDYELARGGTVTVQIRPAATLDGAAAPWEAFSVSGEPTVEYSSRRAPEDDHKAPEPEPATDAAGTCPRCGGCGRIADSDAGEPWSEWEAIPPPSNMAVTMGIVKPIPCPSCSSRTA